jgi:hypothetical protein
MKKISLGLIILATILTISSPVFAAPKRFNIARETENERRKESSDPANTKADTKEARMSLLEKVKGFMKKSLRFEARVKGKITVIGSKSFSLNGEDGTFQVNVNDKTQILRKFGGKSSLNEYSVGDEVVVFGKFTDDTKLIIDAKTIKNNSIQKRFGAFFGKVITKNSDNFTLESLERGTQTVYFGTAIIVNRKEITITFVDIKIGDRVRVKGVWDKTLNKINEVIQIKDFTLPIIIPTQAAQN